MDVTHHQQRKERMVAAIEHGNLEELTSVSKFDAAELARYAAAAMVANALKENTAAVKEIVAAVKELTAAVKGAGENQ